MSLATISSMIGWHGVRCCSDGVVGGDSLVVYIGVVA